MKRHLLQSPIPNPQSLRAFTLVEMLVVITIIGILASMITAAAVVARRRARIAVVVMEVKQLEMACQAYKEKFGEYPPDFSNVGTSMTPTELRDTARRIILRHLARAFPRYMPGITTATTTDDHTWAGFVADVSSTTVGWDINPENLTPQNALTFWLGGMPELNGAGTAVIAFHGFSANPQNPFDRSASRIRPFFDFDPTRTVRDSTVIRYWPQGATGDRTSGAIAYFRAENNAYAVRYVPSGGGTASTQKTVTDTGDTITSPQPVIYPAVDQRLSVSETNLTWMNPASFQIFSSGLNVLYATPDANENFYHDATDNIGPYLFPNGDNYAPNTYDDITNFSNGTLEDQIP